MPYALNSMLILAIETSCDETGIAIIEAHGTLKNPEVRVIKSVVASQVKLHVPFGGVVPTLAKREHIKNLPLLMKKLFPKMAIETGGTESRPEFNFPGLNKKQKHPIDMIAVTSGPGLEPALWMGITFARNLGQATRLPVWGTNHLEGHLFSFLLKQKREISNIKNQISKIFPAIGLVVSGGHTVLVRVESFSKWKRMGETQDDAAGEAYDKVARMLELPYPGGPNLELLALKGNPKALALPRPMLNQKNLNFSFSGLKTAVLYKLRELDLKNQTVKEDVAASFQAAVIDTLVKKTIRATENGKIKSVILSGGVAANKTLRLTLGKAVRKIGAAYLVPPAKYNTDNAAMIAAASYLGYLRKKKYPLKANGAMNI